GYEGDDTYFGGAGNDTFVDIQGTNYFDGGEDTDTVSFYGLNSGIQLNLAQGSGSYLNQEGQQITQTFLSIERVNATIHNDHLTGNQENNTFYGYEGDDTYFGGAGNDTFVDIQGTNYFDGGEDTDTVSFYGLNSGIQLNLAQGSGSYLNQEGQQITQTFLSIERVNATIHDDNLTGNQENNTFYGYEGDDTYFGGAGNDTFVDTQGTNYFDGGEGHDSVSLYGFNSGIQLNLAQESGSYIDGEGQQITQTFLGIERVHATIHDDNLTGNQENNDFYSYDGDDLINSGEGNNFINSGSGLDTIELGTGNNRIFLEIGEGFDTVFNFQLGATRFTGVNANELGFEQSNSSVNILAADGDLLASVDGTQVSTFTDNLSTIFI
ncbi:MAG: calcium-binding protein, partial [Symploca sp. SIO2B6]|nr:calcium-binding protein [Symploca sp. SIO2B6]